MNQTEAVSHFVEFDLDVNSWAKRLPDVGTARPDRCPLCGEPGWSDGRVILHGHGLRVRELRGLLDSEGLPQWFALILRRYACQRCGNVITVGPRGLLSRRRYTAPTIGLALWLWSVVQLADGKVRATVSPVPDSGESRPERWTTLRRWARARATVGTGVVRRSTTTGRFGSARSVWPDGCGRSVTRWPRTRPESSAELHTLAEAITLEEDSIQSPTIAAPSRRNSTRGVIAAMTNQPILEPRDHAERVALFRVQVLGPLTCAQLDRGQQSKLLSELSQRRYRPPGSKTTRTYSVMTLERWLRRYRRGGVDALRPRSRVTGNAQQLTPEQRALVLDIRREYRGASVPLILRTLEAEGRVEPGAVQPAAVRRLLAREGLGRQTRAARTADSATPERGRRRWQVEHPGQLWHADVCHGPALVDEAGHKTPLRIHGFIDDASRYCPMLATLSTEQEVDMLGLFIAALRTNGRPKMLYLDNGSTYRGEILELACARLGITLPHAQPYDPQARGKMERFWRTLREGCLDYVDTRATLHDVQVKLLAFLDRHYHHAAHASLLGQSPAKVWAQRTVDVLGEADLESALTVRGIRRINGDGTVAIGGLAWELVDGHPPEYQARPPR